MEMGEDYLFKVGEVVKICGVTRKALLVYENAGLLTPANKDRYSGFRYYSVENLTQIRSIRMLQSAGLSLKEIAEYHNRTDKIDEYLKRLIDLRDGLDKNISKLSVRSAKEKMKVSIVNLPDTVCYATRMMCRDQQEATLHLRDNDIAAARTGFASKNPSVFALTPVENGEGIDWTSCVTVSEDFQGPERMDIPGGVALCVYYRGPYENLAEPKRVLKEYASEHRYRLVGPFRFSFIEGPPTLGPKKEEYLTRVTVFIEE